MNVQTERLENQTARFTVEIDSDRLDKAKKNAARKLAKRVNIPGFRKGKAPYRILIQNGLEPQILEDAIDVLSQEVYRETLEGSELEPYGPGAFEDFKLEPPTFIYTVPLVPTVDLKDYDTVRKDFEVPKVTEDQVEMAMSRLQEQEAETEESEDPIEVGNRVTIDVHSEFADDPPQAEASESASSDEDAAEGEEPTDETEVVDSSKDAEDEDEVPPKGANFIHEHDAVVRLDPDEEPVLPGFIEALVGANVNEDVEFELTIPDDEENYADYAEIAGRKISFHVSVKKVEKVTLPELNDEFAAKVTESEDEPLTLEQLRSRMHDNIREHLEEQAKSEYANEVLDEMVGKAEIAYPPAMVDEQVNAMIEDLDSRLQQQGINLEMYMQFTDNTHEELAAQYRDTAEMVIRRSLVIREIVNTHNLKVTEKRIQSRIDGMVAQFGEQAAQLRSMFDTPQMRSAMANDIMQEVAMDFIAHLGRGENVEEFMANLEAEDVVEEIEVIEDVAEESSDEAENTSEVEEVEAASEAVNDVEESAETSEDDEEAEVVGDEEEKE